MNNMIKTFDENDVRHALQRVLIGNTKRYLIGEMKLSTATIAREDYVGKYLFSIWPGDDMIDVSYVPPGLPEGDIGLTLASFSVNDLSADQIVELTKNLIMTYCNV